MAGTVTIIPAKKEKAEKTEINVGIYCRVSSSSKEQLNSLTTQIAGLTRLVSDHNTWRLRDTFVDIGSAKGESTRRQFDRMLHESENHNLDIVVTKSISRFGRDTMEFLEALRRMKDAGTRIIFEEENIDTANVDHEMLISIISAIAQEENESRSKNIRMGLSVRAALGVSGLYKKKCYGYSKDYWGNLIINQEQANVVRDIFRWYNEGASIIGIIKRLSDQSIPSPTGKPQWSKKAVENVLQNEKYTGIVILNDSLRTGKRYLMTDSHPAIITRDVYDYAQAEMKNRSNIVVDDNGRRRSHRKYSSKQK